MRLLQLQLRNYRVFEEVDLELPARVIGIFGANGSGKSTLMESILWTLYGTARTAKDQIRTQGVLTDCESRIVFQHGGREYAVRRVIRGKNHQVEAELLTGDLSLAVGVREVEAEVRRLLRMDQQVFRSSVFAEQKQLDAFSDLTKARRKEMVLRLLGIKPVDDARTLARKAARQGKADAERLAGALPDLAERESELEGAIERQAKAAEAAEEAVAALREARASLEAAREAFEGAERRRQQAEKVATRLQAGREEAAKLEARVEALVGRIGEMEEAVASIPDLEQEAAEMAGARDALEAARRWADADRDLRTARAALEKLPGVETEAALAALEEARPALHEAQKRSLSAAAAHEQAARALETAEREVAEAGKLDPTRPCPTCGQPLGEAFRDVVAHREAELADLRRAVEDTRKAAAEAEKALEAVRTRAEKAERDAEAAREQARSRTTLVERVSAAEDRVGALVDALGGEPPDLQALQKRAGRAEEVTVRLAGLREKAQTLARDTADLEAVQKELTELRTRVGELEAVSADLAFDPEEHAAIRERHEEAAAAFEQAARDEREASDAAKDAEKERTGIERALEEARRTAEQVAGLQEEARYADRVAMLLDGFRDHLVARIGPELSREAEALFRELTNHEYEDLKIDEEDLSIQIADAGAWWPIERFSGSETDLANLALRVAISVHLSRMSGADVGLMVLDEVLGSLDAERKDLMVQAMGRLADRFHQLFAITHAEQVKEQFPATIEVRKTGRRRSQAFLV